MRCPDCGENSLELNGLHKLVCKECAFVYEFDEFMKPYLAETDYSLQLRPSSVFEVFYINSKRWGTIGSMHFHQNAKDPVILIISMLVPHQASVVLNLLKVSLGDSVNLFIEYSVSTMKIETCPLCGGDGFKAVMGSFKMQCTKCQHFNIHNYFYLLNMIYEAGFIPHVDGEGVTGNFKTFRVRKNTPNSEDFAILEERGDSPLVLVGLRPVGGDEVSFNMLKSLVASIAGKVVTLLKS